MASLQARHAKTCKLGKPWSTFATATKSSGCTCEPTYYVVSAKPGGGLEREKIGRERNTAKRALTAIQREKDQGEHRPLENITFAAWADAWMAGLRKPGETTLRSYRVTMAYAKATFGTKLVRHLTVADVDRFLTRIADAGSSPSTQAKHLRVLHACLAVAKRRGYAGRNAAAELEPGEKPRAEKREAAYFEDAELPKIMQAAREHDRPLFRLALLTGMREGELVALTWGDVNYTDGVIHVRRTFSPGVGLHSPKTDASRRQVDLTSQAVEVLTQLWKEYGPAAKDDTLVFPSARGGIRDPAGLTRALYRAMKRAGIPRLGPTGTNRTFHSLRHTFARKALEGGDNGGASIHWLQRQLGHSSLAITANVYGHFERGARKREAAKLDGAFVL